MSGLFVALEGGEGSGKSTQARLLAARLEALGHDVVLTREPGATATGARLRELLLDPAASIADRAEALLYAADRAQHVAEVVEPGMSRSAIVVTDRYVASSIAYQAGGRDLSVEQVAALSEFATGGLMPDRTVLLDLDPRAGLARAAATGTPDRLEGERVAFHEQVRQSFLSQAAAGGSSWLVVDGASPIDGIHATIVEWLRPALPGAPG